MSRRVIGQALIGSSHCGVAPPDEYYLEYTGAKNVLGVGPAGAGTFLGDPQTRSLAALQGGPLANGPWSAASPGSLSSVATYLGSYSVPR